MHFRLQIVPATWNQSVSRETDGTNGKSPSRFDAERRSCPMENLLAGKTGESANERKARDQAGAGAGGARNPDGLARARGRAGNTGKRFHPGLKAQERPDERTQRRAGRQAPQESAQRARAVHVGRGSDDLDAAASRPERAERGRAGRSGSAAGIRAGDPGRRAGRASERYAPIERGRRRPRRLRPRAPRRRSSRTDSEGGTSPPTRTAWPPKAAAAAPHPPASRRGSLPR